MGSWYYAIQGQQQGPVETPVLQAMLAKGEVDRMTLVWTDGMTDWAAAGTRPEFAPATPQPSFAPVPMPVGDTSVGSVLGEAWRIFSSQWLTFTLIVLIAFAIQMGVQIIPILGPLAGIFISPWMLRGIIAANLAGIDGRTVSIDLLFSQKSYFFKTGLASICLGLTALGFYLLFLIPGVYVVLCFAMWNFLQVDWDLDPFAALNESFYLMKGHLLALFLLGLTSIFIGLAGLLCLGIGIIPAIALVILMFTVFYRRIAPAPRINS
jgi:hypothetical protein